MDESRSRQSRTEGEKQTQYNLLLTWARVTWGRGQGVSGACEKKLPSVRAAAFSLPCFS